MDDKTVLSKVLKKFIKKEYIFIAVGLCAGILLIVLSLFTGGKDKGADGAASAPRNGDRASGSGSDYITRYEDRLAELIGHIGGISEVKVMITLESAGELVYARNEQIRESGDTTDYKSDIALYSDEKKSEYPILITENEPKIKGAAIVCKRGSLNRADAELMILNLVSAALGLSSNRICVLASD